MRRSELVAVGIVVILFAVGIYMLPSASRHHSLSLECPRPSEWVNVEILGPVLLAFNLGRTCVIVRCYPENRSTEGQY